MAVAVVLALGAGLAYAIAAVLQQRAAACQPPELSLSLGLIRALARKPVWLVGTAADVSGYLLEAGALGAGSVIVVGPLLVSGLLFAIPLATWGTGRRATRREMVPALVLTAGLAVFVIVGSPKGGMGQPPLVGWILAAAAVALAAGACVVLGKRATNPGQRSVWFATGTGVLYGLTAVLTKTTVDLFGHGLGGVLDAFGHWPPYALIVVSVAALVLNQSAFQAGHVVASLPAIAVMNPVVSAVLGVALLGESLGATGPVEIGVTVLAIVAMVVGTVELARSPLVAHEL
jgi:drug/metabolite transporter (DMT)-like permease